CETKLDKKTREEGIQALLYHDILEDTTKQLPEHLSENVKHLIEDMTFYGGTSQEQVEVWTKPPIIKLYKLYDKVSNLLDADWMDDERKTKYPEYALRLCENVEANYGELNITRIARAIITKIKDEQTAMNVLQGGK
ncbi:hypothetical protein HZA33_04175, partial [Candidatus Pacearchaeota archaeon]|nr:hypothetical protein [Candidatus Pacearchaeota archaeon]